MQARNSKKPKKKHRQHEVPAVFFISYHGAGIRLKVPQ